MEVTTLESRLPKTILKTIQGAQGGNSSFQTGIAFIALLVGAVGIITTLYTSVNERIKEIGTMKAIGAKNRFILALFLSEALIIGLLGSTLGLLTGVAGAYVLTSGMLGTGGGGGGSPGSGGGGAPHFAPIFLPNDLLNVWFLSLSLSLASRCLSCLEGIPSFSTRSSKKITAEMTEVIEEMNNDDNYHSNGSIKGRS